MNTVSLQRARHSNKHSGANLNAAEYTARNHYPLQQTILSLFMYQSYLVRGRCKGTSRWVCTLLNELAHELIRLRAATLQTMVSMKVQGL